MKRLFFSIRVFVKLKMGKYFSVTIYNCMIDVWILNMSFSLFFFFCRYEVWEGKTNLPAEKEVEFRYITCILLDNFVESSGEHKKEIIMRRWETNILPRIIKPNGN